MKTFTILEALEIIKKMMPINLDMLAMIQYAEGNKYTFLLTFGTSGIEYIVDLDNETYIKL